MSPYRTQRTARLVEPEVGTLPCAPDTNTYEQWNFLEEIWEPVKYKVRGHASPMMVPFTWSEDPQLWPMSDADVSKALAWLNRELELDAGCVIVFYRSNGTFGVLRPLWP